MSNGIADIQPNGVANFSNPSRVLRKDERKGQALDALAQTFSINVEGGEGTPTDEGGAGPRNSESLIPKNECQNRDWKLSTMSSLIT